MIADLSFLSCGVVLKRGRPPLKSLKGDREGVLSRHQAVTLINHGLNSPKHIPRLVISHSVDSSVGGSDVLRPPVVKVDHILARDVRYVHVLNIRPFTSVFMIRWGGIAAMGSGGGGCPSMGLGLTISVDEFHLTHS